MKIKRVLYALIPWTLVLSVICLYASPIEDKRVSSKPPYCVVFEGERATAKAWTDGFEQVYVELLENLKMPKPPFAMRYAQPGPAWPDDVYLWDTAFISEVWRPWDVTTAEEINLAVLDHADQGRLQHTFSADKKTRDTQPPVMAWSVWQNYLESGNAGLKPATPYLEHAYLILKEYNRWLYDNRMMPCGLFHWIHPFESGMDNSPRFDSRGMTRKTKMKDIAAIDLSSYMVLQNLTLSKMARELGQEEEALVFERQADELSGLINSLLWDEQSGLYYDRNMKKDELIRIKTVASLIPLFCHVPDARQAERLVGHIMNPAEFNTPFPLPSVARDEKKFEKDMWRGPVWINTSYMVILGLEKYGYNDEAAELAFRTVDWVYKNHAQTGQLWEFFDPDQLGIQKLHRKTSFTNRLTMNDKPRPYFVGWTGLVNNLVIEHLVGLKKSGEGWHICPNFPSAAQDMVFHIMIPDASLELGIKVLEGNKVWIRQNCGDQVKQFVVEPGKSESLACVLN